MAVLLVLVLLTVGAFGAEMRLQDIGRVMVFDLEGFKSIFNSPIPWVIQFASGNCPVFIWLARQFPPSNDRIILLIYQ